MLRLRHKLTVCPLVKFERKSVILNHLRFYPFPVCLLYEKHIENGFDMFHQESAP